MFDELLQTVNVNICTVRKIIQTNDKLRGILFAERSATQEESEENTELTKLLEDIPSKREWRVYDHCAAITRLYAIYEGFVEELITSWVQSLPENFPVYSDLDDKIRDTHQIGVGKLLLELKKKKNRFQHLSVEKLIRGLLHGVTDEEKYELVSDAFLLHEQNLRKEAIEQLFSGAGIPNTWVWVENHRAIKHFVENVRARENTAEGELEQLIQYRNEAAHRAIIDETLGGTKLLDLCNFVEALCKALAELVTYKIIERKVLTGRAREVGNIRHWLDNTRVARARIKETNLCVGTRIFLLKETSSYCCLSKIESIRINEIPKDEVVITEEQDVHLQLDICDAKKGLSLYVVE
ncbi:MAE_28990/MAE_18760 family HEPN-like nuclease [Aerosakkonemataceae cyanobacterium BLCC-F50]|uniref:MAE_28990/MAE_18760 family HEPN-like nuclease n=1 Tax=Floridaenema flaviceps BLCC-F50 TaxID=3153642 RepID=A0ABV4Y1X9_9CYAN